MIQGATQGRPGRTVTGMPVPGAPCPALADLRGFDVQNRVGSCRYRGVPVALVELSYADAASERACQRPIDSVAELIEVLDVR